MATTKVTFTLDASTLQKLQDVAHRLSLPKSEIVREAIAELHDRLGRLSEKERVSMLRAFDEFVPKIPSRSPRAIEGELAELRESRRSGGRRSRIRNRV